MEDISYYLPFDQLFEPNKRVYWPYLALCVVYALIFILFTGTKIKRWGMRDIFSKSSMIDGVAWGLNHLLQILVLPLLFTNSLGVASYVYKGMNNWFGDYSNTYFSANWGLVLYALTYFIFSDFTRFALHYLLHHNAFLWRLHRMHHTAEILTPLTFFRIHPFEMVITQIRFLLVHGVITGIFIYFFLEVYDFPKIMGASFFVFFTAILGGNLRHSHVPIGFGIFEKIFLSPKQHQMHHSKDPALQHSNYGSFFALWDRMFSTWKSSKGIKDIEFGVKQQEKQSLKDDLLFPFLLKRKSESASNLERE